MSVSLHLQRMMLSAQKKKDFKKYYDAFHYWAVLTTLDWITTIFRLIFSCHRELDKNRIRHENMPPFQNKLEGRHKEHYYRYKSENHFVFIGKMELSTARAG